MRYRFELRSRRSIRFRSGRSTHRRNGRADHRSQTPGLTNSAQAPRHVNDKTIPISGAVSPTPLAESPPDQPQSPPSESRNWWRTAHAGIRRNATGASPTQSAQASSPYPAARTLISTRSRIRRDPSRSSAGPAPARLLHANRRSVPGIGREPSRSPPRTYAAGCDVMPIRNQHLRSAALAGAFERQDLSGNTRDRLRYQNRAAVDRARTVCSSVARSGRPATDDQCRRWPSAADPVAYSVGGDRATW